MASWSQLVAPNGVSLGNAEGLAAAVRAAASCSDGPLPLPDICQAAMVRVLRRQLDVGQRRHTAMLVPTENGFHALVDSTVWPRTDDDVIGRRRLRFVLAHELGHTFFYRPGRPPTRSHPPDINEERFCHRFATALLVPPPAARMATLDPAGLRSLAGNHDVSQQVAAKAITRARPSVTLLWLRWAPHPRQGGQQTMRVQWGASGRYIPRDESLKSALADLAPGENASSTELLLLAGRREWVHIDAWHSARSPGTMFAVVTPAENGNVLSAPARKSQLSLF